MVVLHLLGRFDIVDKVIACAAISRQTIAEELGDLYHGH